MNSSFLTGHKPNIFFFCEQKRFKDILDSSWYWANQFIKNIIDRNSVVSLVPGLAERYPAEHCTAPHMWTFPLTAPLWQGLDHVTRNTTGGFAIFRQPHADSAKPCRPASGPQWPVPCVCVYTYTDYIHIHTRLTLYATTHGIDPYKYVTANHIEL